jgi:hypothetical protein
VVLGENSETTLAMPGVAGQVDVITFNDIALDASELSKADLTISGTASTLAVVASNNIGNYNIGETFVGHGVVLEAVGVERLTVTTGTAVNSASGDALLKINGAALQHLEIDASTYTVLFLNGKKDGVDQLLDLESVTVSGNDFAYVDIDQIRTGASVTVNGGLSDNNLSGASVGIRNSTLGDVSLSYGNGYGNVYIGGTEDSTLIVRDVSIIADADASNNQGGASLGIYGNTKTEVTIGTVTAKATAYAGIHIGSNQGGTVSIASVDLKETGVGGYAYGSASLGVYSNDDAAITIGGAINVSAEHEAQLSIDSNSATNGASSVTLHAVNLVSDSNRASLRINGNVGNADYDMGINVGSVALTALGDSSHADVQINRNSHADILVGDLKIESDAGVSMNVANNTDTSVTLGDNIDITAGLNLDSFASVNFGLDNVRGAKAITIDASTSLNGYIQATIKDSAEVESLSVSSDGYSSVNLQGDMDAFRTLDIQGIQDAEDVNTWNVVTDTAQFLANAVTVNIVDGANVNYNRYSDSGNSVSEVFTFKGDDIGIIEISHYDVNRFDKLDFSQFTDGVSGPKLTKEDIKINGEGADWRVDFDNSDYGSILLMGAGGYSELEIMNSIIFAPSQAVVAA